MSRKTAWSTDCSRKATPPLPKVWVLVAVLALGGCATYRPMPITPESVRAGLTPPDLNEVRLRARELKHPLLPPVPFDARDGLSPDEAAILAVIANPALRAVRDRRGIAAAQLLQAGILPNPRLSYDLEMPVGGGARDKINAIGIGLGWDLTSLISRNARLAAARARASSVDLAVAWQEWQVAEAARLHTCHLIIAGRRLAATKRAEMTLQRLRDDLKQGVALGVKTQLDLRAAGTSLREAEAQVLDAEAAMDQERLALNRVLGLPANRVILPEKGVHPSLKQCPSVKALAKDAESRRLDLLALRLGYESQEVRVRVAVYSQFPKINLGLARRRDTDGLQTIGMGLNIDLPFFDRNQGHIARERATRKQLFDEYTARLFKTRADIARLMTAIKATQRQAAGVDKSLAALKTRAEHYRQAADSGQIEIFPYYRALNSLHHQQIRKIELEQKMIDLGIALEIASGRYGLVSGTGRGTRKHGLPVEAEASR